MCVCVLFGKIFRFVGEEIKRVIIHKEVIKKSTYIFENKFLQLSKINTTNIKESIQNYTNNKYKYNIDQHIILYFIKM